MQVLEAREDLPAPLLDNVDADVVLDALDVKLQRAGVHHFGDNDQLLGRAGLFPLGDDLEKVLVLGDGRLGCAVVHLLGLAKRELMPSHLEHGVLVHRAVAAHETSTARFRGGTQSWKLARGFRACKQGAAECLPRRQGKPSQLHYTESPGGVALLQSWFACHLPFLDAAGMPQARFSLPHMRFPSRDPSSSSSLSLCGTGQLGHGAKGTVARAKAIMALQGHATLAAGRTAQLHRAELGILVRGRPQRSGATAARRVPRAQSHLFEPLAEKLAITRGGSLRPRGRSISHGPLGAPHARLQPAQPLAEAGRAACRGRA